MPPILFVPASIKTYKKWILDITKTPLIGGYFIILIGLFPPFLLSLILIWLFSARIGIIDQNFWLIVIYLSGILIFFWDKGLRFSYNTYIKIIYVPLEVYTYLVIIGSIIYLYA